MSALSNDLKILTEQIAQLCKLQIESAMHHDEPLTRLEQSLTRLEKIVEAYIIESRQHRSEIAARLSHMEEWQQAIAEQQLSLVERQQDIVGQQATSTTHLRLIDETLSKVAAVAEQQGELLREFLPLARKQAKTITALVQRDLS